MGVVHPSSDYGSARRFAQLSSSIFWLTDHFGTGMEAVVFVGGVSLGQPATSIPIAAIVGLLCGLVCGFIIYQFASRTSKCFTASLDYTQLIARAALTIFLVVMTNFLLLIGAGLFSRAVAAFERNAFNTLLGADLDDAGGDGPGSYRVQGNVWHLNCCNPENKLDGEGWSIFGAIFGWTNSATRQPPFLCQRCFRTDCPSCA